MTTGITPETQALIDAAVKDATEGLAAKNKEILQELKAAKAKAKGADIDPAEFAAAQSKVEELQTALDKSTKESKSAETKFTKLLDSERGFIRKLLVENGLTDAATKAGVKPGYLPAVRALLTPQVTITEDGDTRTAKMGDKPLADAVAAWALTDEGKNYVAAPENSGGGARGGERNKGTVPATANLSAVQRLTLARQKAA